MKSGVTFVVVLFRVFPPLNCLCGDQRRLRTTKNVIYGRTSIGNAAIIGLQVTKACKQSNSMTITHRSDGRTSARSTDIMCAYRTFLFGIVTFPKRGTDFSALYTETPNSQGAFCSMEVCSAENWGSALFCSCCVTQPTTLFLLHNNTYACKRTTGSAAQPRTYTHAAQI